MSANSLWGGPCLYTPMHVDAMIIGTPNQQETFAQVSMNYANLLRGLNPAPMPFTLAGSPPATGIYLHWTLPYSLRRGRQGADGVVDFPMAPNRWLVTRFQTPTPGQPPVVTAWVVQSDYFSTQNVQGSTIYPNPQYPSQVWWLGAQYPLASWAEPNPPNLFLQAQGPGELSWSAVFQNVNNVFGFYDPVSTPGTCTYAVLGWYSKPSSDPLYGLDGQAFTTQDEWQALMNSQGWALGSGDDVASNTEAAIQAFQLWIAANPQTGAPPATAEQLQVASQTLCHGMVFDLPWTGPNFDYPQPGILTSQTVPTVAVGSTAAEAVGAYMGSVLQSTGQDPVAVENLLLAFQVDQITTYLQNPSQFSFTCQENRFVRAAAGTVWVVVLPTSDGSSNANDGSQEIPLDAEQTTALTNLQNVQNQLDFSEQEFASNQWELYSAWWKLQDAQAEGAPSSTITQIQNYINLLTGTTLPGLSTNIDTYTTQVTQQQQALETLLGDGYVLKAINAPQFTSPADPVVLISSVDTDTKLDGPQDIGVDLFTRFTGQALGGLQVDFSNIIPNVNPVGLLPADIQGPVSSLTTAGLPKEAYDMWIENMLLDPGNSAWFAQLACTKAGVQSPTQSQLQQLAQRIATQQTLVWNPKAKYLDQATVAELAGLLPQFSGLAVHVPSKQAIAAWIPPWTPLFLDWEVQWMPSSSTPNGMYGQWQLGETDFTYTGAAIAPVAATLQVRSLLTSNYPSGLSAKIAAFLDTNPDISEFQIRDLKLTAANLATMDVMVQSLTGFGAFMESRTPMPTQTVTDSTVAKWTDGVLTWVSYTPQGVAPIYNPLRAGHFRITRLQVVDAFGQVMPGNVGGGFILPVRSQSLMPNVGNDQSVMQLVPRISQGARLIGMLLDSDDDSIPSNSSDLTSPICGWLLPNHLDESLMVFDSEGNPLGEVIKVVTDTGESLRWDSAPGSDDALGSPPNIANTHLSGLVQSLLNLGLDTTDPLDELLDLIDVTLWSTNSLPTNTGGTMTLLLGQPVAVVRAGFAFNLQGDPIYQQDWDLTGKNSDENFPQVKIPFHIGDMQLNTNGSFCYYVGDDYNVCYAMYGYSQEMGAVRRAVRQPGLSPTTLSKHIAGARKMLAAESTSGGYVQTGNELNLQSGGGDNVIVTLLVDPRGVITSVSGSTPMNSLALPNGPVHTAMQNLRATFRMGPLLLDPVITRMPLPTGISGKWDWIERTGVTFWTEQGPVRQQDEKAQLPDTIPTLREGWLSLSEALAQLKEKR
jgi:hypothetical protein